MFEKSKNVNTKKEVMKMDHKEYDQLAETLKPVGHKMKNAFFAFIYGGIIGILAQGVLEFFMNVYDISQKEATPMMTITLVFHQLFINGIRYL